MELPPGWSAAPRSAGPPAISGRHQPALTARENFSNPLFITELPRLDKGFRERKNLAVFGLGSASPPALPPKRPPGFQPKFLTHQAVMFGYQSILGGPKVADKGQLYVIDPVFSIDCGWLGNPFLSPHFLAVKQFLT